MDPKLDSIFVEHINQNFGVANKIARIYAKGDAQQKDLIQEMMCQLWYSFPTFKGNSKFSTWMYRVCLNTALTYVRNDKTKYEMSLAQDHYNLVAPEDGKKREELSILMEAISMLTSLNKAIVILYLDEFSYEEIAAITGLSKSNVSVRLVRIKKELEYLINKIQ